MEVFQIECEHRKGTVFGVDLSLLPRDRPDEVPFVVVHCTSEIESRALSIQVLFTITVTEIWTERLSSVSRGLISVFCSCFSLRGCIV